MSVANSPLVKRYAELYYERRRAKGITQVEAAAVAKKPLYFASLMVGAGDADGSVGGEAPASIGVVTCAPCVDKENVYAVGESGIACVSRSEKHVLWTHRPGAKVAPACVPGHVIIPGRELTCLSGKDGNLVMAKKLELAKIDAATGQAANHRATRGASTNDCRLMLLGTMPHVNYSPSVSHSICGNGR